MPLSPAPGACIPAPPPQWPDNVKRWTVDRCANMVFGAELIITEEMVARFPGGRLPPSLHIGDAYPVTTHLVRAMAEDNPLDIVLAPTTDPPGEPRLQQAHKTDHPEACRLHLGRYMVVNHEGWEEQRDVYCYQPLEGDTSTRRVGIATNFIAPGGRINDITQVTHEGDDCGLAAYETPWWAEGSVYSDLMVCGQPI